MVSSVCYALHRISSRGCVPVRGRDRKCDRAGESTGPGQGTTRRVSLEIDICRVRETVAYLEYYFNEQSRTAN
jgi:hypothetical protein